MDKKQKRLETAINKELMAVSKQEKKMEEI